jgi:hypothetical protein
MWDVEKFKVFTPDFKVFGTYFKLLRHLQLTDLIHDEGRGLEHG